MLQELNDTVTVNDWNSCLYHITSEVSKLMSASLKKKKKSKNPVTSIMDLKIQKPLYEGNINICKCVYTVAWPPLLECL